MDEKISDEIRGIQCRLVGQRYGGASLSGITLGNADATKVSEWVKKRRGFLVYLGAPGIGKTYLCSALIPWIVGRVNTFRYWKERDFLSRLRKSMEGDGDYIREIHYAMDDEFVMIDDLGSSGFTQWRTEVLLALVDYRYESGKPTVFTSNLTRQELSNGIGPRAASRIFASEILVLEIHKGQDLRQNGM